MNNPFSRKHFLSVKDLTKDSVFFLFQEAEKMKHIVQTKGQTDVLKGKIIACVFFEPSTRTFSSFIAAAQRLGAGIIPLQHMVASSITKGESLEDTIRTIACYGDALVMRHFEVGSVSFAAKYSYVPVINAGDGKGEHPTQALLDAYTIYNHFPSLGKITVGMAGDLKHSRTIRSLSQVLAILGVKKFIWIAPSELRMEKDIYEFATQRGVTVTQTEHLEGVISNVDALYSNRIQKERFSDPAEYEKLKHVFVITPKILEKAEKNMILMNPLPRVGEITNDVDNDPRAVYIREQMQNGVYTRMALLKLILT